MEKGRPHYRLDDIKAIVLDKGEKAFTTTATYGIKRMKLSKVDAMAVMLGLLNFHKVKSCLNV